MPRIADFSRPTITALEKRVANRCSFPECTASTSGPSAESDSSVSNTGTACHIYAASDGPAARRVKKISTDELKHINNGIWMCGSHGRLIDSDECTYTPDNLKDWRRIAERRASLMQALGAEGLRIHLKEEALASINMHTTDFDITNKAQQFILESCISTLWGKNASNELRNFIIEMARNSFHHGNAKKFIISSSGHTITMRSDGDLFSTSDLASSKVGRGGQQALHELNELPENIIVSHKVSEGDNQISVTLLDNANVISSDHPCSVNLAIGGYDKTVAIRKLDQLTACDTIYVFMPSYCISYSDIFNWKGELETRAAAGQKICLVIQEHSNSLIRMIRKEMPNLDVLVSDF